MALLTQDLRLAPVVILPLTRMSESTPLTARTVVGALIAVLGAAVVARS